MKNFIDSMKLLTFAIIIFVGIDLCAQECFFNVNAVHPIFTTAHWGAHVIHSKDKRKVYSYNESQLFIPASVTKVFTSAAAFESLGTQYVFKTSVKASALPDSEGTIHGNIYLIGGSDPTLETKALITLAEKIYAQGVRVIHGNVFGNSTCESSLPIHAEWEDLSSDYASEINALSINDNIVKIIISPTSSDQRLADIRVEQEVPFCRIINNVCKVKGLDKPSISYFRGFVDNTIEINGSIPLENPDITLLIAIHKPQEYALAIFKKSLIDCGITIHENLYSNDSTSASEIASHSSPPLPFIIQKANKTSCNLASDLLFNYDDFSYEKLMNRLDIKSNEYSIYDGSGLSRHNLVSPQQTVKLLEYLKKVEYRKELLDSLPIGGVDGTLKMRLKDIPPGVIIRAKTGSMSGISNLAGYIELPDGDELIFTIFINNSLWPLTETHNALDKFLYHLVTRVIDAKEIPVFY
jgi:D-alanyl-D-alanine carboxypeptidase/D-alanyl-D-alanine-endopeptidase (penicillin-binding protein 4)